MAKYAVTVIVEVPEDNPTQPYSWDIVDLARMAFEDDYDEVVHASVAQLITP